MRFFCISLFLFFLFLELVKEVRSGEGKGQWMEGMEGMEGMEIVEVMEGGNGTEKGMKVVGRVVVCPNG